MFTAVRYLLRPFVLFSLLLLVTLLLSRMGLGIWQLDRFKALPSTATLLFNGLRIDLSTIGYLLLLPAILHPWFMGSRHAILWLKTLKFLFFTAFIAVLFFELATPAFINEYGFRPNRLFIEYLAYPNEVMKMLCNGHLLTLILVISFLIAIGKMCWPLLDRVIGLQKTRHRPAPMATALSWVMMVLVFLICARGTLGHRPINPALVYFSTDPLVNSLTLNSIYSVAHAYKQFGNEKNAAKLYGKMDDKQVIRLIQQKTGLDQGVFQDNTRPSFSSRQPVYTGKPKNLVIILEESLGAQFVSSLGGLPLTPELDKINNQGWAFKRLYATGTRSVRGIEAVITGFTPTPARAVVKLDKSQRNFFTIASLLKDNGYTTQFIYGGESHFDNMKSFFLGNGFTDIVDFKDIASPKFVASWGACDGDLFNQADSELSKLHNTNKPFLSFIFSSSNHDPFEIPEGIITPIEYSDAQLSLYDEKERMRHKAIQYADYALGKFIDKAKTRPYWKDTLFLVVADHDARALGSELVPIKNFHIPGVILNSSKGYFSDERIISQIDLAPTLLSQMGITNNSPMLGHDLNDSNASGRAMMQYAANFAYMQGSEVTILQPQKSAINFTYNFNDKTMVSTQSNPVLTDTALAHALWGSLAYEKAWYRYK
ncbi:LTA synthase family protein [uncultured Paraglaciecola sp.]|uniref:LTA synthase family protein n=1 Tax=uncultured Paraglaciecola sp. TaxID=1765024 RepID=UPI0030DD8C43|tara:strand:- start:156356 stop:158320 length:1965 start_codon:yes stop_codon:yes gene_type:complete